MVSWIAKAWLSKERQNRLSMIYIYIYNKLRARVILSKSDSVKSWSVHVKDTVIKYTVNPTLDLCAHTSRP